MAGYNEAIMPPLTAIAIRDQPKTSTVINLTGFAQSAVSTVSSTIYSVNLAARLATIIPAEIPAVVMAAGFPESSVAGYMTSIADGGWAASLCAVDGLMPEILAVETTAYRSAYSHAYQTVILTPVAFGELVIICKIFVPIIDHLTTDSVAVTLTNRDGNKANCERGQHTEKAAARPWSINGNMCLALLRNLIS
ncbi:hypothetical protein BJ878DRAFT_482780 [Calycina marina]|uniref:Uncharacterized protein n=1 Tax=Calycina marina TaxID=1763456 RepID=A0A9P7YY93_9HELO|nr:hypothetical protein BJ878DRAFT_482780 [Calycina marina]